MLCYVVLCCAVLCWIAAVEFLFMYSYTFICSVSVCISVILGNKNLPYQWVLSVLHIHPSTRHCPGLNTFSNTHRAEPPRHTHPNFKTGGGIFSSENFDSTFMPQWPQRSWRRWRSWKSLRRPSAPHMAARGVSLTASLLSLMHVLCVACVCDWWGTRGSFFCVCKKGEVCFVALPIRMFFPLLPPSDHTQSLFYL